jgi:hypothetical protein
VCDSAWLTTVCDRANDPHLLDQFSGCGHRQTATFVDCRRYHFGTDACTPQPTAMSARVSPFRKQ